MGWYVSVVCMLAHCAFCWFLAYLFLRKKDVPYGRIQRIRK